MYSKLIIPIIVFIFIYCVKKEYDLNKEKKPVKIRENMDRVCSSIYGPNHPKCKASDRTHVKHVGYFKINTVKYPVLDIVNNDNKIRYLLLNNKFYKFKQKYWHRGHYFSKHLSYNENIPYSFISNYTFRGILVNEPTQRRLYAFGKKINNVNYKYMLFRSNNGKLQYAYSIPYRPKMLNGDSIFVRNQVSTFGPFIFFKNN